MRRIALLLCLPAWVMACSSDAPSTEPQPSERRQSVREAAVEVLDGGYWTHVLGCSGICVQEYNVWLDIAVRNDAFHKRVGILWTNNDWASHQTAWAEYEEPLGDGYERWGVDFSLGQYAYNRPHEVEYAVFATLGDVTHWDPRNNYYVFNAVTPEQPLRRLSSEVHFEPGVGGVLSGRVRVLDLAFEKSVTVRYSTDAWLSEQDVEAHWVEGDDWEFRVEGLGNETLPEQVQFALRYRVAGQEYWDNNGGQDYRHRMAPEFSSVGSWVDLSRPVSGLLSLQGRFATDMPIEDVSARLDEGEWVAGERLAVSTLGLSDGSHRAEFRVRLRGGWETSGEIPFQVRNRLQPTSQWNPGQVDAEGQLLVDSARTSSAWSLATDASDRVYVLRDDVAFSPPRVLRYAAYGDPAPELLYEPLPGNRRPQHITVDPQGRLYAVASWHPAALCRFAPGGALDAGFGTAGCVDLERSVAGREVCNAGAVAADATQVFVLDTCNRRVLRFDAQGAEQGDFVLDAADGSVPEALLLDDAGLWVLQRGTLSLLAAPAAGALRLERRSPLAAEIANPHGLLRRGARFWTAPGLGSGSLLAFDEGGERAAEWFSDDWSVAGGQLGQFDLPQGIAGLSDGSVVVLGAEGASLARFRGELLP